MGEVSDDLKQSRRLPELTVFVAPTVVADLAAGVCLIEEHLATQASAVCVTVAKERRLDLFDWSGFEA